MEWIRIIALLCSIFFFTQWGTAQQRYVVSFKDKAASSYSLSQPEAFLSDRALQRRARQNIDLNSTDLPITSSYLEAILKVNGVQYVTQSKWFNRVVIEVEDTSVMAKMRTFPFVHRIEEIPWSKEKLKHQENDKLAILDSASYSISDYGLGGNQLQMLHADFLHQRGFKGSGMVIAVIDAGFTQSNTMEAFQHLRNEGRILGTYDFVDNDTDVYEKSTHGTYVLSTLAALLPGQLIGTAPEAAYYLLRTEDAAAEYKEEEHFWIAAAEYADSAGVDLLNTSLGYTTFDDPAQNYTYADLDGNTAIITKGADMAAAKGMLVINSAGNSGNNDWYYIGAPADGDSVLAIGALNAKGEYADFSSKGPSADNDVKPNVMAQGSGSVLAALNGGTFTGSGTSFSGPILCGAAACLWQALPKARNMDIFRAIERSANLYTTPNERLGFGIPDFGLAYMDLKTSNNELGPSFGQGTVSAFPVPFTDVLYLHTNFCCNASTANVVLYDAYGREAYNHSLDFTGAAQQLLAIRSIATLAPGFYLLSVSIEGTTYTTKVVKGFSPNGNGK